LVLSNILFDNWESLTTLFSSFFGILNNPLALSNIAF